LGGKHVGVIGTLGAFVGKREIKYAGPKLTTPDARQMDEILARMKRARVRTVVMEVSAHGIAQNRTEKIPFRVAVFTNLTVDHLDYFGTIENYARTKINFMVGGTVETPVVNMDDPRGAEIIAARPDAVTFSAGGDFTAANKNACVAVARIMGVKERKIAKRLKTLPAIPGRFNIFKSAKGFSVIVDFAHTPDGLEKILTAARNGTPNRLFVVFGCGGNRDTTKRAPMGKIAMTLGDFVIVTNDNPRNENPLSIIYQIEAGIKSVPKHTHLENYVLEPDRRRATEFAFENARAGDTIVIAGKGAETTIECAGVFSSYSDLEIVKDYLKKR
jgi:UDP-N-acetylmuramoyl-L-alanyl-D-glutamate--2,6-diaminopimelate ligase